MIGGPAGMGPAGPATPATPDSPDSEAKRLEYGRWLFAQECLFAAGAATVDALPPAELPEAAFAGRSNVGKSSLLNALTGRNALARTSHTPGRTRQLNFFSLGARLMLVDLPGYGYAKAPKHQIADWTRLMRDYLRGRPTLRVLCLLIDARHGLKPTDRDLMDDLDSAAVAYRVVLTKIDKMREAALAATLDGLAPELATHAACHPEISLTSAREGNGIAALRADLAMLAEDSPIS